MSGAGEGIAGLALSAVSVAALFTTCIQCFDIVVAGKNFSEDYEQLLAIFGIQRTRFGLWGESVGLIPNPNDGRRLPYNVNIDRRDIRPGVESILNNIRVLLQEADRVDERYGLKIVAGRSSDVTTSVGMNIFKDSFERFKVRIKKNQKQKSAWQVTRWAIHDATKFENLINRLEKYVDGLEKLTDSLGRLEQRLRDEIDTISDVRSLRLLRDATSSHHLSSLQNDISDTASRRIMMISERTSETQTLATASITFDMGASFVTAESRLSRQIGSIPSGDLRLPGAWPKSVRSEPSRKGLSAFPNPRHVASAFKPKPPCFECLEEYYKCEPFGGSSSCSRCYNTGRSCSFDRELTGLGTPILGGETASFGTATSSVDGTPGTVVLPEEVPQNQRLLSELIRKAKPCKLLSFKAGDDHYGESLEKIKTADVNFLLQNSAKFLNEAHNGSSAVKRMFFELRNIRTGNVPFVSAAPVSDSLDKVLARIEGPPETPYENGVFWITCRLSDKDTIAPPMMRFHTRIYHPNISPQGHICADYKEKWSSVFSTGTHNTVTSPDAQWYYGKSKGIKWSLGALLTALCGLLASPDVEDPLVPEIAHKYLTDYDGYCEAARRYTELYATCGRPMTDDLIFLDDEMNSEQHAMMVPLPLTTRESEADTISVQRSLRGSYDEAYPRSIKETWGVKGSSSVDDSEKGKAMRIFRDAIDESTQFETFYSPLPARDNLILATLIEVDRQWDHGRWYRPSKFDIGYTLLERIERRLRWIPSEYIDAYAGYRNVIKSFFATEATKAARIKVSGPSSDWEMHPRKFAVAFGDKSGHVWIAFAPIESFIDLDIAIMRNDSMMPPDTDLADLEHLTTESSSKTLEIFLKKVSGLPMADLLARREFADLVQPAIDPHNDFILTDHIPGQPRNFSYPTVLAREYPELSHFFGVMYSQFPKATFF